MIQNTFEPVVAWVLPSILIIAYTSAIRISNPPMPMPSRPIFNSLDIASTHFTAPAQGTQDRSRRVVVHLRRFARLSK